MKLNNYITEGTNLFTKSENYLTLKAASFVETKTLLGYSQCQGY